MQKMKISWEKKHFILTIHLYILFCRSKENFLKVNTRRKYENTGNSTRKLGLPRWFSDKESTCECGSLRRCRVDSWVRKIPWRRKEQPTPVSLSLSPYYGWEIPWTEEPGGLQSMESQSQTRLSDWACTREGYLSCHFCHPPLWSKLCLPSVSPCLCALGTDCQAIRILFLGKGEGSEVLGGIENKKWCLPAR